MTWSLKVELHRKNKAHYGGKIKDTFGHLVTSDSSLKFLMPSTNFSFQMRVILIRIVLENAVPNEADRWPTVTELLANTNWAHHGEKDTRYSHADVNVDHCDRMVDLFETFAREYDEIH